MSFSGLSTPEQLKETFKDLIKDESNEKLNVIWDYMKPEQLNGKYNIMNILYTPEDPNKTGHYVALFNNGKKAIYFNPISKAIEHDIPKLDEMAYYFEKNNIPFYICDDGTQKFNTDDCGYHCLTFLFDCYLKDFRKGGISEERKEYKNRVLGLLRGIYYQLKKLNGDVTIEPQRKKKVGEGLADEMDEEELNDEYDYKDLKQKYNEYKNIYN